MIMRVGEGKKKFGIMSKHFNVSSERLDVKSEVHERVVTSMVICGAQILRLRIFEIKKAKCCRS